MVEACNDLLTTPEPRPPTPREHDAQGFRDHGDHDHITAAAPFSVLDWELDR